MQWIHFIGCGSCLWRFSFGLAPWYANMYQKNKEKWSNKCLHYRNRKRNRKKITRMEINASSDTDMISKKQREKKHESIQIWIGNRNNTQIEKRKLENLANRISICKTWIRNEIWRWDKTDLDFPFSRDPGTRLLKIGTMLTTLRLAQSILQERC